MAVDYNDERFQEVNREKDAKLNEINNTYDTMINNSDAYYQDLRNAVDQNAAKQTEIQQANTDFAIKQIEQQKEWADKDYKKEQKAAYTDYQKEINPYGIYAEQNAMSGLAGTGYSEASRVSMYNTYQNRVATARESYNRAIVQYDNGIEEARLTNNAALAEISAKALEKNLELALEGFQYRNDLLQTKISTAQTIENNYYTRWQNVLNQINTENALAEQKRQFDASMAEQKRQFNSSVSAKYSSGGGKSKGSYITKDANGNTVVVDNANSDPTEYKQISRINTDVLSASGALWYVMEFKNHSYQKRDLDYVLKHAVQDGNITENDAVRIYNSYGIYP